MNVYGIEFGNTQTCIATIDKNGYPHIIPNIADNSNKLACAVFFENADNVVVGNCAKDMMETDGERVVQFIRSEIGKSNARTYEFDGKTYTPVEIGSLFLRRLLQMIEEQGYSKDDVVVTVPSYFGMEETADIKKMADLSGWNLINVIPEATAVTMSYLWNQKDNNLNALVYDLGGGSFDVSLLNSTVTRDSLGMRQQKILITKTSGNHELGGKDWDDKLFDFILQACCDENGLTPDEIDVETRQEIRSKTELVKKKLSNIEVTKVRIRVNGELTSVLVRRVDFENLTRNLVECTLRYVDEILQDNGTNDIDVVLLAGGSTYMPMIRNAIEAKFPGKVKCQDPDCAAAIGATIYGCKLKNLPEPKPLHQKHVDSPYSPKLIASMIQYAIDHNYDDLAKELISEINWNALTDEELFNFFLRIRHVYRI